MLPSGATVGDDDESSNTRPSPGRFVSGLTPGFAPVRHPGCPFNGTPGSAAVARHPSWKRSRSEDAHLRLNSEVSIAYQVTVAAKQVRASDRVEHSLFRRQLRSDIH